MTQGNGQSTAEYNESLNETLVELLSLRASVGRVFAVLGEGMSNSVTGDGTHSATDHLEGLPSSDKEKRFLNKIGETLESVNQHVGNVEKKGMQLSDGTPGSLGTNAGLISLDPLYDKMDVPHRQIKSYQWSRRIQDLGYHGLRFLHQNSLRRSPASPYKRSLKKSSALTVTPPVMDQLIEKISGQYRMTIKSHRPVGNNLALLVTGRVFKATVLMRGATIETVIIYGLSEDLTDDNGRPNVWKRSKHCVFQKVTNHAQAFSLHYHAPHAPEAVIKAFFKWLESYNNLFSTKCRRCQQYLKEGLPATWHDFATFEAYHEACRT